MEKCKMMWIDPEEDYVYSLYTLLDSQIMIASKENNIDSHLRIW